MPQAPTPSPAPAPGQHDRTKLLEAYQNLVRSEQEKRASVALPVRPPSRAPFWITAVLVIGGLSSVLVLQPEWLFPRAPIETPALQEASLRVRMFVEIDRIEQFRSLNGRLPLNLVEAKADSMGLSYRPSGEAYSFVGRNGALSLTYNSSMSPRDFLGQSYELVAMRAGQ
ncbi:MAG: hypothetical protein ABI587_06910 [Gemmatimonadales bacterium]